MDEQQTIKSTIVPEQSTAKVLDDSATQKIVNEPKPNSPAGVITTRAGEALPLPSVPINEKFTLKGDEYKAISILAQNSGEAQVYLVQNEKGTKFVLKLYYPNFHPKDALLRVLWNMQFELIVKLFDYGYIYTSGAHRFYELMEYLEGGTLNEYAFHQNEDKFARIALAAAGALAYCHNNNIIHKDIKPGNFFFRDKEHTQLVLGDFGISSFCDDEEIVHRTTQARTPLYAAPEMYDGVVNEEVDITPMIDFYSLGITLLFVWLGKNPFSKDERALMRMKTEGQLPMLDQLPARVNRLIRGLTVVNPLKRWKFDEVERWYLGKEVELDESSVYLHYKSFIVDPEKNVIAQNAQELAPLLYERKALGVKYLYTGRISKWLDDCGNNKLAAAIEEIVERRYPVDQEAGFIAALYVLNSSFPYHDINGKPCANFSEITMALLSDQQSYESVLRNPNNELFVYLENTTDLDVKRLRSYFQGEHQENALWKLIYEMNSDIPFLNDHPSKTVEEIVCAFGQGDCSDDEWHSLVDGRLNAWMNGKCENSLCEEIRLLTDGQPYSRGLAYIVLYHLDRDCGFDLKEANSPEKIGAVMASRLLELQDADEATFAKGIADYSEKNGRLFRYAQMHGWNNVVKMLLTTFDLNSVENKERLCAYDLRTASYRFCMILGGHPGYRIGDDVLLQVDELSLLDRKEVCNELHNGCLKQWMTLFYHENPKSDFSEQYSYEYALENYLIKIGSLDNSDVYYKRFIKAKEQVEKKIEEPRRLFSDAHRKEMLWRNLFVTLSALLVIFILFVRISNSELLVENVTYAIGIPVGGAMALLFGVMAFFAGYGVSLITIASIVGALSSIVPITVMRWIGCSSSAMLMPASVCWIVFYFLVGFIECRRKSIHNFNELQHLLKGDINTSLLEPLYYTFKMKSIKYKGSNFGALDDMLDVVRIANSELIIHYMIWCLMMGLLVMEFVCYHKSLLDMDIPNISQWLDNISAVITKWNSVK